MISYRTSRIYPQWAEDALSSSASPFYGNLGASLGNLATEPVSIGANVAAGELRELLKSYATSDISAFNASVLSSELREVLKSFAVAEDIAALSASVISGTLKPALITYSSGEDVAAFSASVVSGNLS